MSQDEKTPLEVLADLLVYAPLGAAAMARDALPALRQRLIERGHDELGTTQEALRNQLSLATSLGRAALKQVLRWREGQDAEGPPPPRSEPTGAASATADGASAIRQAQSRVGRTLQEAERRRDGEGSLSPEAVALHRAEADEAREEAELLAIPDYESLSAAQVNARLATLSQAERRAVRAYEAAHRARRTILARIDSLPDS